MTANDLDIARQLEDVREQQRAISGVLRAVARSVGLQPVLDEVVDAGRRLCGADYGALYLLDDGLLRLSTYRGAPQRRCGSARTRGVRRGGAAGLVPGAALVRNP